MSSRNYLDYLRNLPEQKFLKAMDLGYMLKQTKEKITSLESDINNINQQINDIQKQLKSVPPENKAQLVTRMRELGAEKNALTNQINQLVNLMDRQNDGLKVKLSRLGSDIPLQSSGKITFVDYVSDTAVDIPEFKNRFIENMNNNYEQEYLSDYAKNLARRARLEETSGNVYKKITTLPSFQNRNLPVSQQAFNIDLINHNIDSYLKTKGGKLYNTKKMKLKKRKTKRKLTKKKSKTRHR